MSTREAAINALRTVLAGTGAVVRLQSDISSQIPAEGLITVMEGTSTETPVLSPPGFDIDQHTEVVFTVTDATEPARDAHLDNLLMRFSIAIQADRTLGGAVLWVEPSQPAFEVAEADGAAKSARLTVSLTFITVGTVLN